MTTRLPFCQVTTNPDSGQMSANVSTVNLLTWKKKKRNEGKLIQLNGCKWNEYL
jgi:hypothetical protein